MIKKLYDFRQVEIPAALLQAEVTGEEMAAELQLTAARFTAIEAVTGPIQKGDVVTLEFADPGKPADVQRTYANVGRDFEAVEEKLPGLSLGDGVKFVHDGREVEARICQIKRLFVPVLTDAHIVQLGMEQVNTLAEFENHVFLKLAEGQRKRKFRGIMGIVSKAMLEKTEFAALEDHPWFLALQQVMLGRVAAFAEREGKTVEEALPAALRMEGKSLEECRQALKDMCLERAKQAALGLALAGENGVEFAQEGSLDDLIGRYVDYLNEAVYGYFAPKIEVARV